MNNYGQIFKNLTDYQQDLSRRMSWHDATRLLCYFEGLAVGLSRTDPEGACGWQAIAEDYRALLQTLPYDWEPKYTPDPDNAIDWLVMRLQLQEGDEEAFDDYREVEEWRRSQTEEASASEKRQLSSIALRVATGRI